MTTPTKLLEKIRKEFLSLLKNPDVSSGQLRDFLDRKKQQAPDLINDYQPLTGNDIQSSDSIDWSDKYFSRHSQLAEHNFALERIEHLIKVREHLRKKGVKGFVPSPPQYSNPQIGNPHNVTLKYEPSAQLKKFVIAGDLLTIRTALHMELNNNSLNSEDLWGALIWTKTRVPNLFDAYSEQAFAHGITSDRKLWNSQYYDQQIVYLKTNFSEERFLHLIEVRNLLRQQGVEGFAPVQPKPSPSKRQAPSSPLELAKNGQSHSSKTSSSKPSHHPVLKTALLVGGAVAALAVLLIILLSGQS